MPAIAAPIVIVTINYSNYETSDNRDGGGKDRRRRGWLKKEAKEKKKEGKRKEAARGVIGAWSNDISHMRRISRGENKEAIVPFESGSTKVSKLVSDRPTTNWN